MKRVNRLILCAVVWLCGGPLAAPRATADSVHPVLAFYDVSDMFVTAPHYGGREALFGRTPGMPLPAVGGTAPKTTVPDQSGEADSVVVFVRPTVEDLIDVITGTVEPDSWEPQGGVGSIRSIGGTLFVTQTPEVQAQIGAMLENLRREWRPTKGVRIVAHWVSLHPDDVEALLGSPGPEIELPDAEKVRALLKANSQFAWRAEITCFNRQTVSMVSGRRVTVVASLIPIIGAGALGFTPEIQVLQGGASLEVTPVLMPDQSVVLDLKSQVLEVGPPERISSSDAIPGLLGEASSYPAPGGAVGGGPAKTAPSARYIGERAPQRGQQFATTLRLPLGRPMLVGGMTFEPTLDGQDADARQLYLFVEVSAAGGGAK